MAGLHFDITADNSNFIEKVRQIQDGVSATASVIERVGRNFDTSTIEGKIFSLNKVIRDNETSMAGLQARVREYSDAAADAALSGDTGLFNTITKDITETLGQLQRLQTETEEYRQALSTIEGAAGATPSQPTVTATRYFESEGDYGRAKELREEIESLQARISSFDGSPEGLAQLRDSLTASRDELSALEQEAATAAASLGDGLGGKAAATSAILYELNSAIERQSSVVEDLEGKVDAAREAFDALQGSEDTEATEEARARYETLAASLDNARNQLHNLTAAQVDAQASYRQVNEEIREHDSLIVRLLGGTEQYREVVSQLPAPLRMAVSGIAGMTGAAKAFIATPLGAVLAAIVLALKVVKTWMDSSVEGQMAFAKVSGYVSGVLGQLKEIVITVGEAIYKAFNDPKEAISDLWKAIKENIMSRFEAIGGMAVELGKTLQAAFSLDLDEAKSHLAALGDQTLQLGTGIKNLSGKIGDWVSDVNQKAKDTADIAVQRKELEMAEAEWQVTRQEIQKGMADLYAKMANTSLTTDERKKAMEEYKKLAEQELDTEKELAQKRLDLKVWEDSLTSSTIEDVNTEKQYEADVKAVETRYAQTMASLQRRANSIGRTTDTSEDDTVTKRNERIATLEKEMAEDRERMRVELERKISEATVEAMDEGAAKEERQRQAANERELQSIREEKEKYVAAYVKARKEIFDATEEIKAKQDPNYTKKTFDSSTVTVDTSRYDTLLGLTSERQEKDEMKRQEKLWEDYVAKYGDYMMKREQITRKYQGQMAQSEAGSVEWLTARREMDDELSDLDTRYGKAARSMADLFEDASTKSVTSIQGIIDKYETLIAYMSGTPQADGTEVSRDEVMSLGFTEKDLRGVAEGTTSLKDITDAVRKLKDELGGKSPWLDFTNEMGKAVAKIKSGGGSVDSLGEGITDMSSAVSAFLPHLKEFASGIANILGTDDTGLLGVIEAADGLNTMLGGMGQVLQGDVYSGIMGTVSGLSAMVSAIGGLFGADYSRYEDMVEQYGKLLDIWDSLIAKKQEYIDISYGTEAAAAAQETLDILEKQVETTKTLARERLSSGASAGSHSIQYRMWQGSYTYDGQTWKDVADEIEEAYGVVFESMEDMLDMPTDVLQSIMENYSGLWSVMDDDFREYLEALIEYADEAEDVAEQLQEAMTGVTFDEFQSSFVSALSDLDSDVEDFTDNFEDYLKEAILQALVANNYKSRIQALYDQWAEYAESDNALTAKEAEALRETYEEMVEDMLADRDALMEAFGWDSSDSQSATSGAYQTLSEETGEALEGRFTALQMTGEEMKLVLVAMQSSLETMALAVGTGNATLDEIRNTLTISAGYLEDIARYTKPLLKFEDKMDRLISNTDDL